MKPKKRKVVKPVLKDWPEVDITLTRLCQVGVKRKRLELEMNAKIAAAMGQYTARLNDLAAEDKTLRAEVEQFCKAHREDFEKKKSVKRLHGVLSFRTSPPSVRLLNRKWNWARVIKELRMIILPPWNGFIRKTFDVDKEAVLAHYAKEEDAAEDLERIGLKVVQPETFGIELKHEKAPDHVGE